MTSILEVDGFTRKFNSVIAVDDISINIEKESITGLIGPNGAGKSTLFNLISGLLKPDNGRIYLNSENVTNLRPNERANKGIGRTFQHARVFSEMTLKENLRVVPTPVKNPEAEIQRLLQLVELTSEIGSLSNELSGGQMMLLGLARTLMLQPDIILLDEPFAGVNPGLSDDIVDLLFQLRDEEEVTIFLISHEMDIIDRLCEEVIVMSNGEKLIMDKPEIVKDDERVIESYLGGGV